VARQHPVCQSPRRQECSLRTLGDASWHEASWDGVPVTLQDPQRLQRQPARRLDAHERLRQRQRLQQQQRQLLHHSFRASPARLSGGGSNGGRSIEPPAVSTRLGSGHGKSFGIRPHIAPIRSSGRGQEKLKHLAARRLDALKR
jgi:hypothetical protein